MHIKPDEITTVLEQQLKDVQLDGTLEEVGTVLQVGDGVIRVYGLERVQAGELIVFESGTQALVLNLEEDSVGAVVLGGVRGISAGDTVKRTGKIASISVGEGMLGRVITAMGRPIDGKGEIAGERFEMPLERKAPGVIYRQPVDEPLQTGIKAIDAMVPIGKGQRELIIGDRQTGKTTVALDTIINQRAQFEKGQPVYCIYVAVGQKASSIANVVSILEAHQALEYTVVVAAASTESAAIQFYAPFAGVAIGEYFRDTGRSALVVFDDLSKQAVAYRETSLLLRRPPGREAYPGDVFYLHARLLERAARINDNDDMARSMNDLPSTLKEDRIQGGGSLTALPIIETQAGDVSAYIPTNVISITDGQIFLETHLFNAGIRPAINVGISVSRVGGAAQTQSMKKVAGLLKLEQAQFRELEAFSKFGSELDAATQRIINRGRKNQEILKQKAYSPVPLAHQVVLLYVTGQGCLDELPLSDVQEFIGVFLDLVQVKHADLLAQLSKGQWDPQAIEACQKTARQVVARYTEEAALDTEPLEL